MKKTLLLLVAATIWSATCAQDTIHTTQPFDNYYHPYWHNYNLGDTVICDIPVEWDSITLHGLVFNTTEPITIYGVAVAVDLKYPSMCFNDWVWDSVGHYWVGKDPNGYYDRFGEWHLIGDSSLNESYMDFYIMKVVSAGGIVNVSKVGDSVRLHIKFDTVAYYLNQELTDRYQWPFTCKVLPVYEKYFKKPHKAPKKFYLVGDNHSAAQCIHGNGKYPAIRFSGVSDDNASVLQPRVKYWRDEDFWEEKAGDQWIWLFPILTPNPDSTFYEPDYSTQTSIQMNVLERYVSLQPNPASDEATVLSSFGMTGVEVFDMAGSRVMEKDASGLTAKLDVATLPRGTYIVRIHTPMGTASRKLILK